MLDVAGLKPLDTGGLKPTAALDSGGLDLGGLKPLDTAGLSPVAEPVEEEASWAEIGRRWFENIPKHFKAAGGGLVQAAGEIRSPGEYSSALKTVPGGEGIDNSGTAEFGKRVYQSAQEDIAANRPNIDPESLKGYAFDIATAVSDMVPALGVSIITRNPNIGLGIIGGQVFGRQYAEAREKGLEPDEAGAEASLFTAVETLTEKVPLGILTSPGKSFLSRVVKATGAEGIQEGLTQLIEQGYEARQMSEKEGIGFGEAWDRLGGFDSVRRASIIGAGAGGGLAVATAPFVGSETATQSIPAVPPRDDENRVDVSPDVKSQTTQDDIESPIPTELIEEGRQIVKDGAEGKTAAQASAEDAIIPEGAVSADVLLGAEQSSQTEAVTPVPTPAEEITPQPTEQAPLPRTRQAEEISQASEQQPSPVPELKPHEGSWVIVEKGTLNSVLETFDPSVVQKINTEKYEALPAGEYLGRLNQGIKTAPVAAEPAAPITEPPATPDIPQAAAQSPAPQTPPVLDASALKPVSTPAEMETQSIPESAKAQPISFSPAQRKEISRKTGRKGVSVVYRGGETFYDPLTDIISLGDDARDIEQISSLARKAQTPLPKVNVTLDDGSIESVPARQAAKAYSQKIKKAAALLECLNG